ncbi:MAG: hypothetical protein H8D87_06350 [Deltaproteobacteria bacterium]|nr:hypothetical protein [Candidatus Desulfobacula maris]
MSEKQENTLASKNLWKAVLLQAIHDLKRKSLRDKAMTWFKSDNDSINSFIGICGMMGIHPDKAREIILKKGMT